MTEQRPHTSSRKYKKQRRPSRIVRTQRRPLLYYVFWKPFDVLSQFKPSSGSSADTLASYVNVPDIYPVGRLDRDSEGLLLLSNDGLFQHKMCDPKFDHWRSYFVQVERTPNDQALEALRAGIMIKGQRTRPARVKFLSDPPVMPPRTPPIRERKSVETAWLKLSLTEGRNRQVRRMTAAVGHPTLRLIRSEAHLSEGGIITLEGLQPGEIRPFTDREIEMVNTVKQRQRKMDKEHHKKAKAK